MCTHKLWVARSVSSFAGGFARFRAFFAPDNRWELPLTGEQISEFQPLERYTVINHKLCQLSH